MAEQSITRDWFVMPEARRAALADWCGLRAEENRRAVTSHVVSDAVAHAEEASTWPMRVKVSASVLPDHASQVMPISGVHVMPVFGRGEIVAPYVGGRVAQDTETHEVTWEAYAAWGYVAQRTMGDAFMARVMHVMTSEATDNGRPVDWGKRDDVASMARVLFVDSVVELMTREDVYRLPAADGADSVGGIGEWGVSRAFRCGQCKGCKLARESESAARASRYSLKGCEAPRTRVEWLTPSRVLSRAVWRAAGDVTLATSSVYATRSKYLGTLAALAEQDARVSVDGTDALSHVPAGVADVLRLVAAACAITGDNVVSHNGGLSPAARSLLCLVLGAADSKAGTTTAVGRLRAVYTPENRRERAERRARERCQRDHAEIFVSSCHYCREGMNAPEEESRASVTA